MKRPGRRWKITLLAAALCVVGGSFTSALGAAQRIKLTTLAPKGSSPHRALQKMGQAWREASGGAVDLIIYPGGIQGGEAAMVERMWINQSQAGLLTGVGLMEIEPTVSGLQNLPMMFRSLSNLRSVMSARLPMLPLRSSSAALKWYGRTGTTPTRANRL